MTLLTATDRAGYDAAQAGCAWWPVPQAGSLRIAGDDRVDFVQRQTTNDVALAAEARAPLTVLTSATARILDVWRLLPDAIPGDGDAMTVLTLPGRGAATARYLQSRIFFMDQVTVQDVSAGWAQVLVVGPGAAAVVRAACRVDALPEPGSVQHVALNGHTLHLIGEDDLIAHGVRLLLPVDRLADLQTALGQAGGQPLLAAAYDVWRIERGLPGAGELTDDYTPLETNLDGAISDAKGCYTGQEIIARQITYDKVTRRLVGVRPAEVVPPGATVMVDGRRVGVITSAAQSPQHGPLALAILKRPHFGPGIAVMITGEDGIEVTGETVALPLT